MTDLRALNDAFGELERRADAVSADLLLDVPSRTRPRNAPRPGSRLVPVAAAVAVMAGLATGMALLAPGGGPATQAGGSPTASTTVPTAGSDPRSAVPDDHKVLTDRFRAVLADVLGDTATFTATELRPVIRTDVPPITWPGPQEGDPPVVTGPRSAIVGTLTAAGVTGRYQLATWLDEPGGVAGCSSPEPCTMRELPDGSSLATAEFPLEGGVGGTTYSVHLARPDGGRLDMHVSNWRWSPEGSGSGEVLAPRPPLTIDQMIAIVTSDRW